MKVAMVTPRYFPYIGGIETHVRNVSEALVKIGIQVEVLTTDSKNELQKEETINNVLIRRFKSRAPMEAFYFSHELKSYIGSNFSDYDVVHAHSYHDLPALYVAQAKESAGAGDTLFTFTPHYHGKGSYAFTQFLHLFYKPIFGRKIFKLADIVICVSKYEKELVERDFPVAKYKIVTIPNGVARTSETLYTTVKTEPSPQDYIMYVGRVEQYKRVHRIVSAIKYLSRSDVSLVIIGKGPSKKKILKLALDLGIEKRIFFYENLSEEELDAKYKSAKAVINLSKFEAFGLTVAEALSRGTPCVVAKSSALSEWVDGVNCVGVEDPENPKLVAEAIDLVMDKRVSNVKLHSWEDVANRLFQAYERHIDH